MDEILRVEHLYKSFMGLKAVQDINITVKPGQIVSLIGPNGAGKTTVFNLISGFYPVDEGHLFLDGEDVTGFKAHQYLSKGLVRTFQNVRLFKQMTALENILVGSQIQTRYSIIDMALNTRKKKRIEEEQRNQAMAFLDEMGMKQYANKVCSNLAYGLQKKLEIIRAIACKPKLLLVDEPAAGLNPQESEELSEFIKNLTRMNITVMLIEHDLGLVMGISDYIYVMDHGAMLCHGTPEHVQKDDRVIEAYIGKRGMQNVVRSKES